MTYSLELEQSAKRNEFESQNFFETSTDSDQEKLLMANYELA